MQNIIRTATGYRATFGGQEWDIPNNPDNRLFKAVAAAIAEGEPVTDEAAPDIGATQITFAQMLIGLVEEGWITEEEGEAWLLGTLPAPVLALIGQMPRGKRFAAKARAIRPSTVLLSDPLVQALGDMQGKSADMPGFFRKYSQV